MSELCTHPMSHFLMTNTLTLTSIIKLKQLSVSNRMEQTNFHDIDLGQIVQSIVSFMNFHEVVSQLFIKSSRTHKIICDMIFAANIFWQKM